MSAHAEGYVWKCSPYKGTALLIHLAIADVVNDAHDFEFWMLNANLQKKARAGKTAVSAALATMVDDGYLEVLEAGGGRSIATLYRFLMPRINRSDSEPLSHAKPPGSRRETVRNPARNRSDSGNAPITNQKEELKGTQVAPTNVVADRMIDVDPKSTPTRATRPRDEVWDALMLSCSVDASQVPASARSAYGKCVKDLKAIGATPFEIGERARAFQQRWPGVSLTPTALVRRWAECTPTAVQAQNHSERVHDDPVLGPIARIREMQGRN